MTLPTQQAKLYKKNLKETGRKPERRARAPPEQHFDDCGDCWDGLGKDKIYLDGYSDDDGINDDEYDDYHWYFEPYWLMGLYGHTDYALRKLDKLTIFNSMQAMLLYHTRDCDRAVVVCEIAGGTARTSPSVQPHPALEPGRTAPSRRRAPRSRRPRRR